jgi:hypothetical protein
MHDFSFRAENYTLVDMRPAFLDECSFGQVTSCSIDTD